MSILGDAIHKTAQLLTPSAPAERQTAPLATTGFWSGQQGTGHSFKPKQSLDAFGDNVWLFRAVNTIANEYAKVMTGMYVERKASNGDVEVMTEHGALDLLEMPMSAGKGRTLLTKFQMHKLIAKHALLTGEAMLLMKDRDGFGLPTAFFPLLPHLVEVVSDADGFPEKYLYRVHGETYTYLAEDVIHFKDPDPQNFLRGQAVTKPMRWALDQHLESELLNLSRLQNRAIPDSVLYTDQPVNETVGERILGQFKKLYGGSKKAGKVALLPNGLKFQKTQDTNAEMQFKELKDDARDEVLAAMGVGMEMLGKTDSQTRANAEAAFYSFMKFAVGPFIDSMLDAWTTDYLHVVFNDNMGKVCFAVPDFVPSDMDDKRSNNDLLFKVGAKTPNEIRQEYGLDALPEPEADETYLPLNVSPITSQGINLEGSDKPDDVE